MAKEGGLGDQLYIDGYALGGDIQSLSNIHGGPAALDTTDITQGGNSRIGGHRDGGLGFVAYFNPDADRSHDHLSSLATTDAVVTYCHGGAIGKDAACLVAKQLNYDGTRGADGALTFNVDAQANGYGLEWGTQLTAGIRVDSTATSPATGYDFSAASSFGWQAWLHVFGITGTSCTVTLQDSANNSAFTTLSGAAFSAATVIGSQRLQSASATATVRQYVRVITSGTFSSCAFAVVFTKNDALVSF